MKKEKYLEVAREVLGKDFKEDFYIKLNIMIQAVDEMLKEEKVTDIDIEKKKLEDEKTWEEITEMQNKIEELKVMVS